MDAAEDSRVGLIPDAAALDRPSAGQVAVALDPNRHLVEKQFKDVAKAPDDGRSCWAVDSRRSTFAAAIPQNDEGAYTASPCPTACRWCASTDVGRGKRTQFAIYKRGP